MAKKRMTKAEFVAALSKKSGLTKQQAASALDAINVIIAEQLGKRGPGEVLIPNLVKLNVVTKPASPQHKGVNPFTREPMIYKAKPASKVIKLRALKALKDSI